MRNQADVYFSPGLFMLTNRCAAKSFVDDIFKVASAKVAASRVSSIRYRENRM